MVKSNATAQISRSGYLATSLGLGLGLGLGFLGLGLDLGLVGIFGLFRWPGEGAAAREVVQAAESLNKPTGSSPPIQSPTRHPLTPSQSNPT